MRIRKSKNIFRIKLNQIKKRVVAIKNFKMKILKILMIKTINNNNIIFPYKIMLIQEIQIIK